MMFLVVLFLHSAALMQWHLFVVVLGLTAYFHLFFIFSSLRTSEPITSIEGEYLNINVKRTIIAINIIETMIVRKSNLPRKTAKTPNTTTTNIITIPDIIAAFSNFLRFS